jgi:hypothetical protein
MRRRAGVIRNQNEAFKLQRRDSQLTSMLERYSTTYLPPTFYLLPPSVIANERVRRHNQVLKS